MTGPNSGQAAPAAGHPCLCGVFEVIDPATGGVVETTGCEAQTSARFAPGHDAKLKSLLIRAGVADLRVRQVNTAKPYRVATIASQFGFESMVEKAIAARVAKLRTKRQAASEKPEPQDAPEPQQEQAEPQDAPEAPEAQPEQVRAERPAPPTTNARPIGNPDTPIFNQARLSIQPGARAASAYDQQGGTRPWWGRNRRSI